MGHKEEKIDLAKHFSSDVDEIATHILSTQPNISRDTALIVAAIIHNTTERRFEKSKG